MRAKLMTRLAMLAVASSALPAIFSSELFAQGPVTINGASASFNIYLDGRLRDI